MTMQDAKMNRPTKPVSRLQGTGIKLIVTDKQTGKATNSGVQLNNTTLEIEALPNLRVEILWRGKLRTSY